MPPRRTTADLLAERDVLHRGIDQLREAWSGIPELVSRLKENMQLLKKENEDLKKEAAGRARSRSPRRPSLSSQACLETSCRALNQVSLWRRDGILREQREEILQLRSEVRKKEEEIAGLRRGEGPLGEVLYHSRLRSQEFVGASEDDDLEKTIRERLLSRTQPVHEALSSISHVAFQLGMFAERGYPVEIMRIAP
jgi:hypothetical protein